MFDAATSKFRDIQFERLNTDEPSSQSSAQRYNVKSIPTVVFLDGGGKEVFNGSPPSTPEGFFELIERQ